MVASDIATLVKQAVDIVDVVSQAVPLRRAGNRHLGLCPFHQEKTPSFHVDSENQLYYCFGCGSGGDVLSFVMKHRAVSFAEAIEYLADRYHINLPPKDSPHLPNGTLTESSRREREQLQGVLDMATEYYYDQLHHSPGAEVARNYILQRGLPAYIVETERIGYAPDLWDGLLRHLEQAGIEDDIGIKAGLLTRSSRNKVFDRFRNRLIFPIRDEKNRVIAFGGRILSRETSEHNDDSEPSYEEPKYLNSPETSLYHKGRILYQLAKAREACRQIRQVVLVEGYLDLLAFHNHGFYRVVATLGTALTTHQVRLLSRFTDEVVLAYDGDEAGERAMLRALPLFLQEELAVSCVRFPDGMDPDDFLRKRSMDGFTELLNNREELGIYALQKALDAWDGSTMGKGKVLSALESIFTAVRQPLLRAEYLRLVADRLSLPEGVIERQLHHGKQSYQNPSRRVSPSPMPPVPQSFSLEESIVRSMIKHPNLIGDVKASDAVNFFSESPLKELAKTIIGMPHPPSGEFNASAAYDLLRDSDAKDLFTRFILESGNLEEAEIHMRDWLDALLKHNDERQRLNSITEALSKAQREGDAIQVRNLLSQLQGLHSAKKKVKGAPENV